MEYYKAKIPDGSEVILNGDTIVIDFDMPIMLSKEQVDLIIKHKTNLRNLGDYYALELKSKKNVVLVRINDILLHGK